MSLDQMVPSLREANRLVDTDQSKTIHHALILGKWLDKAYLMFLKSKKQQDVSWKKILINQIGIDESHARQLREIAAFYNFTKIHCLAISISDQYKKRKLITKFMQTDQQFRTFWQGH